MTIQEEFSRLLQEGNTIALEKFLNGLKTKQFLELLFSGRQGVVVPNEMKSHIYKATFERLMKSFYNESKKPQNIEGVSEILNALKTGQEVDETSIIELFARNPYKFLIIDKTGNLKRDYFALIKPQIIGALEPIVNDKYQEIINEFTASLVEMFEKTPDIKLVNDLLNTLKTGKGVNKMLADGLFSDSPHKDLIINPETNLLKKEFVKQLKPQIIGALETVVDNKYKEVEGIVSEIAGEYGKKDEKDSKAMADDLQNKLVSSKLFTKKEIKEFGENLGQQCKDFLEQTSNFIEKFIEDVMKLLKSHNKDHDITKEKRDSAVKDTYANTRNNPPAVEGKEIKGPYTEKVLGERGSGREVSSSEQIGRG